MITNKIVRINGSTFNGCSNLISITIPNSVTYINFAAFYGCSNLKDIYYIGDEAKWNAIIIDLENDYLKNATSKF